MVEKRFATRQRRRRLSLATAALATDDRREGCASGRLPSTIESGERQFRRHHHFEGGLEMKRTYLKWTTFAVALVAVLAFNVAFSENPA